ncbi:MAG: chromosome segregation protein SMC [Angelakisella sp.]|jgi:chromosome segregation protein|nr:chromosome segregation protein SMC [Angelakisella sp.]
MRLRGIELQGFKSFADRTKLTFDDGITAVVGPNGSGKSNISDAIKWVFGEQSSKSLRGAKMEDVIFGGTKSRNPLGYTWVSLFIDNTDRSIDVDSDEVVLTRKLYRSGESEYRVNNNLVRLKDINEIFMDTGLGRDGYSIIEQGKIGDIVGAKSTQRREIFEEAAGISKFRYRKGEAERRLSQAEENLIRLRDIMGELEGRVAPLKAQSEKAQQFLILSEEKKTLEISLWLERLEKLRQSLRTQEDKILVCKNDQGSTQARLDQLEEEFSELRQEIQDCAVFIDGKRQEIKTVEEAVSSAQVEIAVKETDISHNRAGIQALEKRLADSAGDRETLSRRIEEARAAAGDHGVQLEALRREIEGDQKGLSAQKGEQDRLTAVITSLGMQKEALQGDIASARVSSETSATLVEETVVRLDLLRDQAKQKDQRLLQLREEHKSCKAFVEELTERLEGLANTKNGYLYKQKSRGEKLAKMEEEQRALDRAAGEKLQRAQLLSDMERNMEGFQNSVKTVMKHAAAGSLRGVVGPVSELIRVEKEFVTAVEIALGAAMQNLVVEDEGVAKRAIRLLVDAKAGRCTFLPLSAVQGRLLTEQGLEDCSGYRGIASELVGHDQRFTGIIRNLLGRTVIAEDIDSAVAIAKRYSHRFRVVTLDGQVVNAGGSMTGGYVGKNASILSRRTEIERLQREARELAGKSKELEAGLSALRQETAAINALVEGVDGEARTAGEDLAAANAELRRLAISVQEAEELGEQSLREFDALTARVEELRTQGLTSGELVDKLSANLAELDRELQKAAENQNILAGKVVSFTEMISQKQVTFAAMEKDQEAMELALRNLLETQDGSEAQLRDCRRQKEELEAQNASLETAIREITAAVTGSRERVQGLEAEIASKARERDQCEGKTTQLRQEEKNLSSRREALSGELARLEERFSAMSKESESILTKMWDEYEITKTEAAALAIPLEDPQAAQRRLGELKNRIRSLGTVNVAAIEEYKEVAERYTFYKTQIDDVERSKEELGKLIGDLSEEMSRIFLEKFSAINHNFGLIFTELFGGGHGELKLTDPSLPLETGIDIFVQPPGKMVGLSLLSGGEKAIVAICVYFAILKVNPAPFVLIDEIEAALDDVNVNRFAAYMRQMTDKTQFIAITHRRGTMEGADVLYGVTMEEEGVSKLLKLDIGELEQKLNLKTTE